MSHWHFPPTTSFPFLLFSVVLRFHSLSLSFFFLLNNLKTLFVRVVLGSRQNWVEVQRVPRYSLLLPTPWPPPALPFVTIEEPTWAHHYRPKSTVYTRVHFWYCTFYGFRRIIMPCIHGSSIIQNSFTGLKIAGALFTSPSQTLATIDDHTYTHTHIQNRETWYILFSNFPFSEKLSI